MKKVIYIEIDEEITSIYDRVKNLTQKEIYLVVPSKAVLFQSIINLKILKRRLLKSDKKIILVTSDRMGRHIAEQINIKVCSKIEIKKIKAPSDDDPDMKIEPIQARRNQVVKDTPRRFTEKKMTIGELIKDFRKKSENGKSAVSNSIESLKFSHPNRKLLALILMVSVGLFMLISYIAFPGATIYVRPKFDNISHTVNVVLADKRKNQKLLSQNNPHIITSEEVVTVTKQTKVFNTTSKEFDGVNATGRIKIINTSREEWPLKEKTRFQSPEGLIFRINKGLIVPPATLNEEGELVNGEMISRVEADSFDLYDDPVGDRGNIGISIFTIPGLSKYNQKLIWAESIEPMKGGVTSYKKVVLEEDIEAAKKQIQDNLILMAREDLYSYIEEINKLNNTNLVLLDDRRYLNTELQDIRISEDIEGTSRDKFEVFAKIKAEGMAYDSDQLYSLLKKELEERTHPDMHIQKDSINPDTINYEVIDEGDKDIGQIKITATIQGIEEYIVDSSLDVGLRFSDKIKDKILGLKIAEAENYINNLPEVDAVEIKLWPIWISAIPRIPENIEVALMDSK
jgi:hypothetical protein